ncbi:MAG TPA: class D sortase [Bryobacteraceae bacterium]|nr:class D sortase [Bryobacteraceae bacterium]
MRWSRAALFVTAAALLGDCVFVLANAWIARQQANLVFVQLHPQSVAAPGELVGRMEIPRLNMSVAVAEGTDAATLRRAAGHILGTSLPGRIGNIGIAGHRDTLFRPLRHARHGDLIVLVTSQGEYRYRVVSTTIVSPTDVAVLNPDGREILTLVTCYPFYFIGPAPDRFIVRAERFIQPI